MSRIIERLDALLAKTPPFNDLPEDERADILSSLSIEYFKQGEVVLEQGTQRPKGLYLVESGLVRLMDVAQQKLLDKCGEGDYFGSFSLLKSEVTMYEARAVEPTVCAVLEADRFRALVDSNEAVESFFDRDLKQYVRRLGTTTDVSGAHRLLGRRLSLLPLRTPPLCGEQTAVKDAMRWVSEAGGGALVVLNSMDEVTGIVTESDVRDRLLIPGLSPDVAVSEIMSSPVATISPDATLFDAMMEMLGQRVDDLVVHLDAEPGSAASGPASIRILSERDIAHFRGQDPIATVQRLDSTMEIEDLQTIRDEISLMMALLYRQEVPPERQGRFLTALYDRVTVRVIHLAEQQLREEEAVTASDLPWCWMRFGSSGRQEMVLTSQQSNGIVYATPQGEDEAERAEAWFAALAERVNKALELCGFPLSEIVASMPAYRTSLKAWKRQYRTWIFESDSETIETIWPCFDLRGLYGETSLADELKDDLTEALNVEALDNGHDFLGLMARAALRRKPTTGVFKRIFRDTLSDDADLVDIREEGTAPIVDAARLLALEARYFDSVNTFDRLRHAATEFPEDSEMIDNAHGAYQSLLDFRLEQQLFAAEGGVAPTNQLNRATLTKYQRNLLRQSLDQVNKLQSLIQKRYA
jgi:CBS domain-containing protein